MSFGRVQGLVWVSCGGLGIGFGVALGSYRVGGWFEV